MNPNVASVSRTLRVRNSGFSEPGPLLLSPRKKQTQIQAEVGLGISPFVKLSPTADPQALSPEESQSCADGRWVIVNMPIPTPCFQSRSPRAETCPIVMDTILATEM